MASELNQKSLKSLLRILNEAKVTAFKTSDMLIVLSGKAVLPADLPEEIEHEIVADADYDDDAEDDESLHSRLMGANFKPKDTK